MRLISLASMTIGKGRGQLCVRTRNSQKNDYKNQQRLADYILMVLVILQMSESTPGPTL